MNSADSGSRRHFEANADPASGGACAPSSFGPGQPAQRCVESVWPRVACASLKTPSWTVGGACASIEIDAVTRKMMAVAAIAAPRTRRTCDMRGIVARLLEPQRARRIEVHED